jgi:hypothetical protein
LICNVISLLLGFILKGKENKEKKQIPSASYDLCFCFDTEIDGSVRDVSGDESFMDGGGRKSKMAIGAGKVAVIHGDGDDPFNGCTPHDARASSFSCSKDNLWWPSLYECVINCPCMVNCN